VNSDRIGSKATVSSNVVAISGRALRFQRRRFLCWRKLLEDARAGTITGLAVAVLRSKGSYDLRLRGNAAESGNQMSVAGMLAALQKMVFGIGD